MNSPDWVNFLFWSYTFLVIGMAIYLMIKRKLYFTSIAIIFFQLYSIIVLFSMAFGREAFQTEWHGFFMNIQGGNLHAYSVILCFLLTLSWFAYHVRKHILSKASN